MTLRLSAGALRFLGTAGFLNGSAPEDFAHLWHENPGGGIAAIVYLVWERHDYDARGIPLKVTYHSKLLFTSCTVFEASDGWPGGLVRVFDQGSVSILVVVIVIVLIFFRLCFCFGLGFRLCLGSFCELPLFLFRGFIWFIQLVRVIPIRRLLQGSVDKKSATKGSGDLVILSTSAFFLCLSTTCARCWSIRRPSTTSDCRRCDSGFLCQFKQGFSEMEEDLREESR